MIQPIENNTCISVWPQRQDLMSIPYLIGFNAASIILALGGNMVLLIAIIKGRLAEQNTMVIMLTLAISDLLLGIILLPMYIFILTKRAGQHCVLEKSAQFLGLAFGVKSGNCLFIVSLDRYFLMCHTHFYTKWITPKRVKLVLLLSVGMAFSVSGLSLLLNVYITFLLIIIAIFTYFGITSCCYVSIIITVRKHLSKVRSSRSNEMGVQDVGSHISAEIRAAWTLFILLAAKLFCYLPFGLSALIWARKRYLEKENASPLLRSIYLWTLSLAYVHSAINPMIFIVRNLTIRSQVKDIFRTS